MNKVLDSLKSMVGVTKAPTFIHVERELAALLGVAQDLVKEQRQTLQLTRGTDWELVKGAVTYSDPAAKKILGALSAPNSAEEQAPAAAAAAPVDEIPATPATDSADLVCVKLPRNRRIILARLAGDPKGPIVRVRVKDSGKFTVGMELKGRLLSADLYQLDGNAPRFQGRF